MLKKIIAPLIITTHEPPSVSKVLLKGVIWGVHQVATGLIYAYTMEEFHEFVASCRDFLRSLKWFMMDSPCGGFLGCNPSKSFGVFRQMCIFFVDWPQGQRRTIGNKWNRSQT